MSESFIEAILTWSETADKSSVHDWLRRHGLNAVALPNSLLITGSASAFESAFGTDVSTAREGLTLPVPQDMNPHVSSIRIPPLRKIHQPKQ